MGDDAKREDVPLSWNDDVSDYRFYIPAAVEDAMRALRPETRAKLSLRDIDDMTRPFRTRVVELEAETARLIAERDEARRLAEYWRNHAPQPDGMPLMPWEGE